MLPSRFGVRASRSAPLLALFFLGCGAAGGKGAAAPGADSGVEAGDGDVSADAGADAGTKPSPGDGDGDGDGDAMDAGKPESAPSTLDRRVIPTHALEQGTGKNPSYADTRATDLAAGYGAFTWGPGSTYVARTLDGTPAPAWGPHPKRLVRFAHLSDLQLADDESTTRVATLDATSGATAAMRPQDAYLCQMANAAVRAINQQHAADPLSFTLLGGDNVDSAQPNELDWLVGILNGGHEVECDSGDDDDLVSGPGNDPKDPFMPEGLAMPWYWVSGNHDELVQGNLSVGTVQQDLALGSVCALGTRDYSDPDEVRQGTGFPVDSRRKPMLPSELMTRLADTDDGHGIGSDQVTRGKAFYHFDIPNTPLRIVVMDTVAEAGGASGMLRQADVDAFVVPAIEEARAQGRMVILTSHHSIDALTTDGGTFGTAQTGALLPDDFRQVVGAYDNVLFSLVGHAHILSVKAIQTPQSRSYWEVMTASIADYPHELRVIEIWDGDNGHMMMRATAVDMETEGDALAETARTYGMIDFTTGWAAVGEQPGPEQVNVELWIKKPELSK